MSKMEVIYLASRRSQSGLVLNIVAHHHGIEKGAQEGRDSVLGTVFGNTLGGDILSLHCDSCVVDDQICCTHSVALLDLGGCQRLDLEEWYIRNVVRRSPQKRKRSTISPRDSTHFMKGTMKEPAVAEKKKKKKKREELSVSKSQCE